MTKIIYIELYKLLRQPRTWFTFGLMTILLTLINIGMAVDGKKMFDMILQPLSGQFIISGNLINSHLISYLSLNMLWVHIPIILVIVTGDMVSGEFEAGTIRLVLCSSISRWQWLAAKIIVAFVYILAFMFFCGILMILPSRLYFGSGDLLIFNAGIQVIEEAQIYPKFIIALLFGTLGMCAFASVSIMFSVLLRNSLAAILTSLGLLIVSTLIQTFGMGIFESWQPLLFTWHMAQWQQIFVLEPDYFAVIQSALILGLHMLVFLGIAFYRLNQMKITE
jgi:ABC-2 type transport system permease protein